MCSSSASKTNSVANHLSNKIAMQLSYVITGAHWNASYDVRVESGEKTIELTYYGVITNNSTDDWLNVRN